MSCNNKVIWSEGLFLKPQHFQQQDRYIENYINKRCRSNAEFQYGFEELEIDEELLSIGKLAIRSAKGILPDGTPFNIPRDDDAPAPIDFQEGIVDQLAYLAIPLTSMSRQIEDETELSTLKRYKTRVIEVDDDTSVKTKSTRLKVGGLQLRLLLEDSPELSEYSKLAIAKIRECNSSTEVKLDKNYIVPTLNCNKFPNIHGFLVELKGLLNHRATALANRLSGAGSSGAAEISDFLLLQTVNQYIPILDHLVQLPKIHSEELFRMLAALNGNLATFSGNRIAPELPQYQHDNFAACFAPLRQQLRDSLSMVLEQRATQIPLKEPRYGIYRAPLNDKSTLDSATFVLAVKSSLPQDELRRLFINQYRIGTIENIRDLIKSGLAGFQLQPLAVAPREIPYHSGYVYFELDSNSSQWQSLHDSSGFAIQVGGNLPDLTMEFWSILRQ